MANERETAQRLRNADTSGAEPDAPFTLDDIVPPVELRLGPPFALAVDCDLLGPTADGSVPGAFASVQCGACSTPFALDLLRVELSRCPECKAQYTHSLIVAPVDATEAVDEFMETVAAANGYTEPDDDSEVSDAEADDNGAGDVGDAEHDDDDDDDDGE